MRARRGRPEGRAAMSDEHAFALRDAYVGEDSEQPFAGATMAYGPDGRTADLGQMLEDGGGFILTSDPALVGALREHEFFKGASKAEAEAAGAELLTPNADGTPPTPDEPEAEAAEEDQPPEPQAPEPVNFESHSLDDLRGMYADELGSEPDDGATRRELADAINGHREASGAEGGSS